MGKIERIVLHCSDSPFGSTHLIDEWHRQRGWWCIGYNWVILNGYLRDTESYWGIVDGAICPGRDIDCNKSLDKSEVGAHVYGFNRNSVGICLIGKNREYTSKQLSSLKLLLSDLLNKFELTTSQIVGHYELDESKTCPGLDMDIYRSYQKAFPGDEESSWAAILLGY